MLRDVGSHQRAAYAAINSSIRGGKKEKRSQDDNNDDKGLTSYIRKDKVSKPTEIYILEVAAPVKYFLDNFVDIIAYLLSALRNCRFEAD